MSGAPQATVLITTRNRRGPLRLALDSVLEQEGEVEILVLDDASTDGTPEMVRRDYPGVRLVTNDAPAGCPAQRNRGIRLARGPVVVCLDDDAWCTSRRTVVQVLACFDRPEVAVVTIPYLNVNRETSLQQPAMPGGPWAAGAFDGGACAIRREAFLAVGGYPPFFQQGEETDLALRLLDAGWLVRVGDVDHLVHAEVSPRKDASHYRSSAENHLLGVWRNVPARALPGRMLVVLAKVLMVAARRGHVVASVHGVLRAARAIAARRHERRPVSRQAHRRSRRLLRGAPMTLAEAAGRAVPHWLVLAQEPWDEVERRNQLLCRALAQQVPRSRTLFAEIPLRPSQWRAWALPRVREVAPGIDAVRAIRPFPDRLGGRLSDRLEVAQVRIAARRVGLRAPIVWTQDPRVADLLELLAPDRLVQDLTDDWAAFEQDPHRREAVQRRIEALGAAADVVLACSPKLAADARAWAARVELVPNAVEPPGPAGPQPAAMRALARPRLGYVGTQHASRLDVALLERLAELRPGWSVVLLGPDHLGAAGARLRAMPNVHHLGTVAHREVRDHLAALDVCLIPHVVDDFTRSLDPLKLYEYLAAGRPVVATPVGVPPELASHVTEAATADETVLACEAAMRDDDERAVEARKATVATATWDARAAQVLEALGLAAAPPPVAGRAITAVVVSYNTRSLLDRCLSALRAQVGVRLRVIVVDNGSTDGSLELVRERHPEVELLATGENLGFGAANNLAFARCAGDDVLLVNSDAFLAPDSAARLAEALATHADAGAVGPQLRNEDGSLQRSAWPFPSAGRTLLEALLLHRPLRRLGLLEDLRTWGHDEDREVPFLIGACLLLRAEALAEAGGFDERFWLYAEEADLLKRLADRGWTTRLVPTTAVVHVAGASSAVSETRLGHFTAAQRTYFRKHGGPLAWPVARLGLLVGAALRGRPAAVRAALRG